MSDLANFSTKELVDELERRKLALVEELALIQGKAVEIETTRARPVHTIDEIVDAVSTYFQIQPERIIGSERKQEYVRPRHIAMFLCDELTQQSVSEIARYFDLRDHASIIYAIRKIGEAVDEDRVLFQEVSEIRRGIVQGKR
jgi:chromosomal replication initiation ATPase DnaA